MGFDVKLWIEEQKARNMARAAMRRGMSAEVKAALKKSIRETAHESRPKLIALTMQRYTYRNALKVRVSSGTYSGKLTVRGSSNRIDAFSFYWNAATKNGFYEEIIRGKRKTIPLVFWQIGKKNWYRRESELRYPIRRLYGPGAAEMVGKSPEISEAMQTYIGKLMEEKMARELG